jgi:hypothetical protein
VVVVDSVVVVWGTEEVLDVEVVVVSGIVVDVDVVVGACVVVVGRLEEEVLVEFATELVVVDVS